ncbi:predicted protein [Sclerotinia sclerotiorum 1980 UF-70]|uniref:Uncharacterized protein n=1 Tax=Sclerotinia sclerotiorum (strain ATCC 18683 / 1980 / Ss-1) TaxID=665079 RepID=A7F6I9_SCLS1|nr:predicted protein [Sclerotinia sclerotiorum 1980 UF-70]EDN98360.1 predicted protein [Sclerotinia sclerotiorum 1980 UF-70]
MAQWMILIVAPLHPFVDKLRLSSKEKLKDLAEGIN